MQQPQSLTRSALAELVGVSPGTVGHWHRKGLLLPAHVSRGGNGQQCLYDRREVPVAEVLAQLRELDFPVASNDWLLARLAQLRSMVLRHPGTGGWAVLGRRDVHVIDDHTELAAAVAHAGPVAVIVSLAFDTDRTSQLTLAGAVA